jgi:hypothetical protein
VDSEAVRKWLDELIPKASKKAKAAIVDAWPDTDCVFEVDVHGTRAAVETVEAYGLDIDVDANGRATVVRFPDSAAVAA